MKAVSFLLQGFPELPAEAIQCYQFIFPKFFMPKGMA
jgi:hypothetical protein